MSDAVVRPPTRLFLARHGEVERAYQRVFGGRLDMALSPQGHAQSAVLAEWLRQEPLDALYLSPMRRAQETAAPLLARDGLTAVTLESLREVDFGAWTGLSWEQVRERFKISPFEWLRELERGGIPAAEPGAELASRVAGCLTQIREKHPGRTVLVLCHGGVIRAALAALLDLPLAKLAAFEVDYASLTLVEARPGRVELKLLNFTPWRTRPGGAGRT